MSSSYIELWQVEHDDYGRVKELRRCQFSTEVEQAEVDSNVSNFSNEFQLYNLLNIAVPVKIFVC